MQLSLQNFQTLVRNAAAAVQSSSAQLLDLTVGSVLRAVLEANASVALWMQWLILQVLQTARAATSTGPDLDSWMADFSLSRLAASASTGTVTFSRYTPTQSAFIPVGALVRTADGAQTFSVIASMSAPSYNPAQNGYVVGAGIGSLDVPVQAQIAGISGNIQAAGATQLATAIPAIDTVTNEAPFQNGLDAEADVAFRARFANYINSRSKATVLSIGASVGAIQQGLQYAIQENQDTSGNWRPGSFVVTVDDGSGAPSTSLLGTAAAAIDAVRAIGTTFAIQPPQVSPVVISLAISVSSGVQKTSVAAAVSNAIASFVNALPLGAPLPLTRVAQIAYGANGSVSNVTQVLLNGLTADVIVPPSGVVKASFVSVS